MTTAEPKPYGPRESDDLTVAADGDVEFVLAGCLTVEDAIVSHRLATRGFWPRIVLAVLIVTAFCMVLIAVAVVSRPYSPGAANAMMIVACVVFPALTAVPAAFGRLRLHYFARRQLGVFAPTHSTFSLSKIVATTENAKSELQWPLFSHCIANETVADLFFRNSRSYLILARRKLENPVQWDAFVSMIQAALRRSSIPNRPPFRSDKPDSARADTAPPPAIPGKHAAPDAARRESTQPKG